MNLLIDTKQIYLAMAEKSYNGEDLAKAAGVSSAAVSAVLNGKRRGTTKVVGNICKALGLSVKDIVVFED